MPAVDPMQFVKVLKEHINKEYESRGVVEGWQKLPEIPSAEEIMPPLDMDDNMYGSDDENSDTLNNKSRPTLPTNIVNGPWGSITDYVGSHYQLIREDAVGPLRDAVAIYKASPSMKDNEDIAIYNHVYIIGMTFSSLGPASRIEFSLERSGKRIRWKQSKRLQQGTIVALSPTSNNFRSICKIAVVAARPLQGIEQNPPQLDLFWGDPSEAEFDPAEEYVMIEARSGYFEASRYMLVAMQKLMTESFPLSDHLVGINRTIDAPEFRKSQPWLNLNSLAPAINSQDDELDASQLIRIGGKNLENVDVFGQWPDIGETQFDQSQMAALRRILSKRLAIIQGPPGTGKTFISISALTVMLDNWCPGDPPIIIAAQTNHAIDQLLNLIAPVEPNFLRLGGRTTEDNVVVKARTLYEVRNKTSQAGGLSRVNYRNARKALESSTLLLQIDIDKVVRQGIDEASLLLEHGIITQAQYESLHDEDWACAEDPELPLGVIALWLGQEQLMAPPRCLPANMGFEEEDDAEFEALEEVEIETSKKENDDIDTLNGTWYPFKEVYVGRRSLGHSERQIRRLLASESNLWDIPPSMRGEVHRHIRRQLKMKMLTVFRGHLRDYHRNVESVKIARWQADATLIATTGIKLIGCTTTGLSKYRGLLASLQPRTLLIEEAAETLEGTILAAMFESLQQLILVGDHQQLQAKCNNSVLGDAPYNLAVSMFERLVMNGLEYTMLNKQRRMISEIRELLNPFYPNLEDHHSVLDRANNRKPIPGMGGRDTYFFHHRWPESRDDSLSRFNLEEAKMITSFFTYLVLNGIEPARITVLTYYNGQRKLVVKKLRSQPELKSTKSFNVSTVDSYQGEENDVILLSLVRSNPNHLIGFLENKNRAVVSLSRARRGLYIFGNSINLLAANTESFKLWSTVTQALRSRGHLNIDSGLPIVCSNHHTETIIRDDLDWKYFTGGCRLACDGELPCGHRCLYQCHPFPHEDIICREPCPKELSCGHRCSEKCGDGCRCSCDVGVVTTNKIPQAEAEMWQLSLDDVLADSAVLSRENIGRTESRRSNPSVAVNSVSNSGSPASSPRKWREWDAVKADKALDESEISEKGITSTSVGRLPMINEIHRPVAVKNGVRVRQPQNKKSSVLRADAESFVSDKIRTIFEPQEIIKENKMAEKISPHQLSPHKLDWKPEIDSPQKPALLVDLDFMPNISWQDEAIASQSILLAEISPSSSPDIDRETLFVGGDDASTEMEAGSLISMMDSDLDLGSRVLIDFEDCTPKVASDILGNISEDLMSFN